MKTYAQTVIIGAGIVGCSTAYYLAHYGVKDVLILDKGELFQNDGSTAHAPGGVNPLSNSTAMAQFATASIDLYASLPLWKPGRKPLYMVGGVDLARTDERMDEVRRLYSNGKGFGVEAHIIGPREISDLFPLVNGNLFKGALYTPRKPVIAGPHVSGSLAQEAERMAGHRFVGQTKVTDFVVENGRLSAILTNNPAMPHIQCERVLLCTNIWAPALTAKLGLTLPLLAAEHQYLKTEPLPQLAHVSDRTNADHEVIYPSVRDLDGGLYYRHWWDSMGIGSYHHRPILVRPATLGESADHPFTPDDFTEAQKMAEETIPALKGVSFPYRINGMFSFSVDGMPILGETPIKGCWVATAVWLSHAGGVGKAMAQWMTFGEPDVDMRQVDLNRFLPYQKTDRFIQIACAKSYAEVHDVVHPAQWSSKPRNLRLTPFHRRHEELRAVFQPNAGLEMPYWLEENQRLLEKYDAQIPHRTGWSAQYWSRIQGAEHLAMRESAGLFDLTNLAIIEVEGDDACAFANTLCTSQMDIPAGRVAYTLLCTPKGGIKRDITAARLAPNRYWFFTGNGTLPLELEWFHRYAAGFSVTIRDLSHSYAALGLFGPNARRILQKVTPNSVANDAFPLYSWQTLEIGMATAYAMRLSYVGELGWEFHLPMDTALAVRDELWAAGREFNLVSCGVGAMRSMRVEKGYRLWGADIYTEHNPYEAGMGWMVKLNKGNFVGREALQAIKNQPLTRRLVTLTLDDPNVMPTGNEPVWDNGRLIGQITSGNYGYTIGRYITFAYLPPDYTQPGTQLEIEYLAQRYPATVTADTLFDAANARMKA